MRMKKPSLKQITLTACNAVQSSNFQINQTKEDRSTVTLAALRRDRGRDKRVAVLVGGADAVAASLESALPYGAALEKSDILIVPLVLEARPGMSGGGADMFRASGAENDLESAVGSAHVALPVALNRWQEYIDSEVSAAMARGEYRDFAATLLLHGVGTCNTCYFSKRAISFFGGTVKW